jgi:hypothetical protein
MAGLEDISQTKFVVLDDDWQIAVMPRDQPAPVRRPDR